MRKYIGFIIKNKRKAKLFEIKVSESIDNDEIFLDKDIDYCDYNDDVLINATNGFYDDIYLDDTLYYTD
ncbi:MAG: hypothetical protein RRZ84_03665 [Romboutsia sp.]